MKYKIQAVWFWVPAKVRIIKLIQISNISFFFFFSWSLVTLQYCSGFCHTLTWISHGFTCIPHPDSPPPPPSPPDSSGLPSAPGPSTCLMHPAWASQTFLRLGSKVLDTKICLQVNHYITDSADLTLWVKTWLGYSNKVFIFCWSIPVLWLFWNKWKFNNGLIV